MLFSSIPFLYYFLPCVILCYLAAPKVLKNTVLLVSSLIFYAWGEPRYVFLMIITVTLGYILGLLIEKFRGSRLSKLFLTLSLVTSLGALGYFKYADFFISNFNTVTGLSVGLLNIALPIGISFYTFQILSYTIDVYRGAAAQKNPVNIATYIALFPQLIAGPIVRYSDIEHQLTNRTHSFEKISHGIRRFICGLAKKIIIANSLGELGEIFMASGDKSVVYYWLVAFAFMFQMYFDFSGYSDMAIGLGKIFGFEFMENFRYPFISKSITEFWRRWHISLGTWFRDYLYIPLGGNRVRPARHILNIFIVWFLTGFWHGAEWVFIAWGIYFAIILVAEKFFLSEFLKKHRVFSHVYVIFILVISFILTCVPTLGDAAGFVGAMFGAGNTPLVSLEALYYLKSYGVLMLVAAICSTPLPIKIRELIYTKKAGATIMEFLEIPVLVITLLVCTAYLADGSFNPFLYFRF